MNSNPGGKLMTLPKSWEGKLSLPVVASPMFLTSTPELVIACCKSGVVGTFPVLNERRTDGYAAWLDQIETALSEANCNVPFGVNLVVHRSNARLEADLAVTVDHKVPLIITSLGLNRDLIEAVHGYGGLVFHDVVNMKFAEKAIDAGVDGLIAVTHGAGGHAGTLNPFAFIQDLRSIYDGTLLLGGSVATGSQVLAAQLMGADLAYMGSRFLATEESSAPQRHKELMVAGKAEDIVLTPRVSGLPGNFLRNSFVEAGLDPDDLTPAAELNLSTTDDIKPWRDLWASGQGIGAISDIPSTKELCARLQHEYQMACKRAAAGYGG